MGRWTNAAHESTPLWRIALLGAALALGVGFICETLLRLTA